MYLYTKSIAMTLCSVTAALAVVLTGLTEEPSTPDASSMPYTASQSQAAGMPDSSTVPGPDAAQREESGSVPTPDIEAGGAGVPDASSDSGETEENTANAAESPVDAGEEEDGAPRAALMPPDTPSAITRGLAMLLATNQADSIMGSLGLARSDECRTVQAVLRLDVPFPVSWTVKMKKKQKETQDILSYHSQAAGCSDKARAKASGGRQPIEECGRTGL